MSMSTPPMNPVYDTKAIGFKNKVKSTVGGTLNHVLDYISY